MAPSGKPGQISCAESSRADVDRLVKNFAGLLLWSVATGLRKSAVNPMRASGTGRGHGTAKFLATLIRASILGAGTLSAQPHPPDHAAQ